MDTDRSLPSPSVFGSVPVHRSSRTCPITLGSAAVLSDRPTAPTPRLPQPLGRPVPAGRKPGSGEDPLVGGSPQDSVSARPTRTVEVRFCHDNIDNMHLASDRCQGQIQRPSVVPLVPASPPPPSRRHHALRPGTGSTRGTRPGTTTCTYSPVCSGLTGREWAGDPPPCPQFPANCTRGQASRGEAPASKGGKVSCRVSRC